MKAIYKLEIYVPASHLHPLREALSEAGAGVIGNYDRALRLTYNETRLQQH